MEHMFEECGLLERTMTHATIHRDAIKQLFAEMQRSFDSNGPLRVAVDALIPDRLGASVLAPTGIDGDSGRSAACTHDGPDGAR